MRRIATVLVLVAAIFFSLVFAVQNDSAMLAGLKNIYMEPWPNGQPNPQRDPLTRQLRKVGFDIVNDRSQADAILTIFAQAEIVVDGDGSIPNKSIFTYELRLPNNTLVWKHRIKFVSRRTSAEDDNYAAQKMAAKLLKDKEASARRGARK